MDNQEKAQLERIIYLQLKPVIDKWLLIDGQEIQIGLTYDGWNTTLVKNKRLSGVKIYNRKVKLNRDPYS